MSHRSVLTRRTFHGSIRAEYTAISLFWLQHGFALFTFIKMDTCIDRHFFHFSMAAHRTGNSGTEIDFVHVSIRHFVNGMVIYKDVLRSFLLTLPFFPQFPFPPDQIDCRIDEQLHNKTGHNSSHHRGGNSFHHIRTGSGAPENWH